MFSPIVDTDAARAGGAFPLRCLSLEILALGSLELVRAVTTWMCLTRHHSTQATSPIDAEGVVRHGSTELADLVGGKLALVASEGADTIRRAAVAHVLAGPLLRRGTLSAVEALPLEVLALRVGDVAARAGIADHGIPIGIVTNASVGDPHL